VGELAQGLLLVRERERQARRKCVLDYRHSMAPPQSRLTSQSILRREPVQRQGWFDCPVTIEEARGHWEPSGAYLNTASFGLPPTSAWNALQQALVDWRHGQTSWEDWCAATDRAREHFAAIVAVPPQNVATGASASYLVGLVAAGVPDGSRVLVPEVDFSSLTWPFLAHGPRVDVRTAPLEQLADAIDSDTDVVAFSAVQSSNGAVADLDGVARAAAAHGAFTMVDATHAIGWLPFDASRFDAVASAAYKWLLSPRGTAFLALSERALEQTSPLAANWFAADDVFGRYYDAELRLAADARRLDLSPAWFSWVGTEPALALLREIEVDAIHEYDLALANRFRAGLGFEPGDSAIVSADIPGAEQRLLDAGVRAAVRDGSLRASFHLYNTEADVDAALSALLD
jgi:selenocysteine lyase/cysteine desulfurase